MAQAEIVISAEHIESITYEGEPCYAIVDGDIACTLSLKDAIAKQYAGVPYVTQDVRRTEKDFRICYH